MSQYLTDIDEAARLIDAKGASWNVNPENVARMRAQNRFRTGIEYFYGSHRDHRPVVATIEPSNIGE